MNYCYLDSPVGPLLLAGGGHGLAVVGFAGGRRPRQPAPDWILDEPALGDASRQLREYFSGRRKTFDLELAPHGTPFQLDVLAALREVPYGETATYGELARRIGRPKAVRAVGQANGRNPLAVVIPCHRIIGADGRLTGFGGGLPIKRKLLELEGVLPPA